MYIRKTPPELQTGMFVITRAHKVGLVLNGVIVGRDWFNPVGFYFYKDKHLQVFRWKFENEKEYSRGSELDIIAIYKVENLGIYLDDLMTEDALQKYGKLLWYEQDKEENNRQSDSFVLEGTEIE